MDYYREEIDHLQAQCKQSREIGELAGLAMGAKQLLAAETEVLRLKSVGSHEEGVVQQEDSYRGERDRAREAGLRWQVEDLSSALERVQLKLEETNIQCEQLALHTRALSLNAPKGSDSQGTKFVNGGTELLSVSSYLDSGDINDPPNRVGSHHVQEDMLGESTICGSARVRERNVGEESEEEKEMEEQRIEDGGYKNEEKEKASEEKEKQEKERQLEILERERQIEVEEKERQIELVENERQIKNEEKERQIEIEEKERQIELVENERQIKNEEKERKIEIEEKEKQIELVENERQIQIEGKERKIEIEEKERQIEIDEKMGKEIVAELTLRLAEYKKEEMRWSRERISWQEERAERISERRQWQGLQHSWEEDSALERWKLSVLAEEIKCKWDEVQTVTYIF